MRKFDSALWLMWLIISACDSSCLQISVELQLCLNFNSVENSASIILPNKALACCLIMFSCLGPTQLWRNKIYLRENFGLLLQQATENSSNSLFQLKFFPIESNSWQFLFHSITNSTCYKKTNSQKIGKFSASMKSENFVSSSFASMVAITGENVNASKCQKNANTSSELSFPVTANKYKKWFRKFL